MTNTGKSNQNQTVLLHAIAVAQADGSIAENEKKMLYKIGDFLELDHSIIDLAMTQSSIINDEFLYVNESNRMSNLLLLFRVAIADGVLEDKEIAVLCKIAIAMGYEQDEIDELIHITKHELEKDVFPKSIDLTSALN